MLFAWCGSGRTSLRSANSGSMSRRADAADERRVFRRPRAWDLGPAKRINLCTLRTLVQWIGLLDDTHSAAQLTATVGDVGLCSSPPLYQYHDTTLPMKCQTKVTKRTPECPTPPRLESPSTPPCPRPLRIRPGSLSRPLRRLLTVHPAAVAMRREEAATLAPCLLLP